MRMLVLSVLISRGNTRIAEWKWLTRLSCLGVEHRVLGELSCRTLGSIELAKVKFKRFSLLHFTRRIIFEK